jgi:uncharacterized protein
VRAVRADGGAAAAAAVSDGAAVAPADPIAAPTVAVPSRARIRGELLAVLASAALHFVATTWLHLYGVDVVVLGTGWLAYVVHRARTPGVLARWGLTRANLGPCARAAAVALATGAAAIAAIGLARGTFVLDLALVPLLLAYPLWGWIQQLLVLGIVVRGLEDLGCARAALVPIGAVGFAAVHVPDWPLCAATLTLGVVCCALFLRYRNLWPLGVLHGWLGALFYRCVLARDPWSELLAAWG